MTPMERVAILFFNLCLAVATLPAYFVALIGSLVIDLLQEEKKPAASLVLSRAVIATTALGWRFAVVCAFWLRIKVDGLEFMRATMGTSGKPCIILANHTSFLDIIMILSMVPLAQGCKVKMLISHHIFEMPAVGRIAAAMGHLSVPFKAAEDDHSFQIDKELMAERQQKLEDWVRSGGNGGWYPEGRINPGDTHEVGVFRAGGMVMAVRNDVEIWCFAFVGNAVCWPKRSPVGGFPATIGVNIFRLCESSHKFCDDAGQLPDDADERAKSLHIANSARDEVQARVTSRVAEGLVGHRQGAVKKEQ